MTPAAALRRRLAEAGCLAAPGVYDVFTARIAEAAGAEAVYVGGNALGLHLGKGQPFVTATETTEAVSSIHRSTGILVVSDIGAGFGAPAHVRLAVRDVEAAGAAAIHIDDQPYPKDPDYHRGRGSLESVEAVCARFAVAASALSPDGPVLIARTDALRVSGSLEEAIARGRAYIDAGAEALMILDLTPDQAGPVREAFPDTPLVWIGGVNPPIPTLAELDAAGFKLALYPFNAVAAVTTAVGDLWRGLMTSGRIEQSADVLARARAETTVLAGLPAAWAIKDSQ